MSWFLKVFNSSVGCKLLMALSGLIMVLFLVGHLAGNLLVFVGPDAIDTYAKTLRDYIAVLWVARLGLIGAVVLHIYCGIRLSYLNKQARPEAYYQKDPADATLASRSLLLSGLVILSFIIYHLAHLTFRLTHPSFEALGPYEVYKMLILSFQSPWVSSFYIVSLSLLMLHLSHGIWSLMQSLGLNHSRYNILLKALGPLLSIGLMSGFLSIPLAIWFGFIQ
mgnify:CR=1 FL=1